MGPGPSQVANAVYKRRTPIRGSIQKQPMHPEISSLQEDSRLSSLRNISAKRRNVSFKNSRIKSHVDICKQTAMEAVWSDLSSTPSIRHQERQFQGEAIQGWLEIACNIHTTLTSQLQVEMRTAALLRLLQTSRNIRGKNTSLRASVGSNKEAVWLWSHLVSPDILESTPSILTEAMAQWTLPWLLTLRSTT